MMYLQPPNQSVWELHWPYILCKPRPILCANHDLLMLLDIPLNGVMTEELPSAKITLYYMHANVSV